MTVYVLKEGTLCEQNDSGALKFPQKMSSKKVKDFYILQRTEGLLFALRWWIGIIITTCTGKE